MKTIFLQPHGYILPGVLALLSILAMQLSTAYAQDPGFTYQGRLNDGGVPANGVYDFRFSIYNGAETNATSTLSFTEVDNVATSNGLFTAQIPAPIWVFNGEGRWLAIEVRTNATGEFTMLHPWTEITPTPYAVRALTVTSNALEGGYGGVASFPNPSNVFVGTFSGDGGALSNVAATTLGGLSASNFWQLGGNAGTTAGTHFLGTTDDQPLELKVNGQRVLRLEPTTGVPNVIGGSSANSVEAGVTGATIVGGGGVAFLTYDHHYIAGDFGFIGGGLNNSIGMITPGEDFGGATIVGGFNNSIGTNASGTFIGGGAGNQIRDFADEGVIGGGYGNMIGSAADYATIGGGEQNLIVLPSGANSWSTIGGGLRNTNGASAGTIGGGVSNSISGDYATIPGGLQNSATNFAFAAGRRAKAVHQGAFVWSDSTDADFASTTVNQFAVRAQNGIMIQGTTTALDLRGDGAIRVAGAGVASQGPVFIHRATAGNTSGHITTIDNPLANGDPNAILMVTHNFSADTSATPYETGTVGVWYNGSRWTIYHENTGVAMPVGRAFNVMIIKP